MSVYKELVISGHVVTGVMKQALISGNVFKLHASNTTNIYTGCQLLPVAGAV